MNEPVLLTMTGPENARISMAKELVRFFQMSRRVVRHYPKGMPEEPLGHAHVVIVEKGPDHE